MNRNSRIPFASVLLFLLVLAAVLLNTNTVASIKNSQPFHYHYVAFLPGTPPLKVGYERTDSGIQPIIETHRARAMMLSINTLCEKDEEGNIVVSVIGR